MKNILNTLKRWWMAFARALGWLNTRVLLSIVYAILIGIPALVLKLLRKDLLDGKIGDRSSYWIPKEHVTHSLDQAKHQF